MGENIEGLKGVEIIADDVEIVGFGNTCWVQADRDRNVPAFLNHCHERNLKSVFEPAQLPQETICPSVAFAKGQIINSTGQSITVTLFAKTRHKKVQRFERSALQRTTNVLP